MTTLPDLNRILGALWGKSSRYGAGRVNLLVQHLLDTAAVAELVWDHYLAPSVRQQLDDCCAGRGRELFVLVCALHDVGKASPAFQSIEPALRAAVAATGLSFNGVVQDDQRRWRHEKAGGVIVRRALGDHAGWRRQAVEWVWPLIAGHHGRVWGHGALTSSRRDLVQGTGPWLAAQDAVVRFVTGALGMDLATMEPTEPPPRAVQLALLGALIMADWVASDPDRFGGVDQLASVSISEARSRAKSAWGALGLRGGWDPAKLPTLADPVAARFGRPARPAQSAAVELAERMPAPGLLIVEAPMGEGKTEAALAAAEVLARRFGADGVFVGMPTQATSDPMFGRVRAWAKRVEPGLPIALLHGKRQFNEDWHKLAKQARIRGVHGDDEYGMSNGYGSRQEHGLEAVDPSSVVAVEWFLGHKRGMLTRLSVGTIDNLLHAGTRTKHVMMRHAGLVGRVVVLDEVHSYDVYMSQFLFEALWWLGNAGVPVIVLTATLPPKLREDLATHYLRGALLVRDVDLDELPEVDGYPTALSACAVDGEPTFEVVTAPSWRPSLPVRVDVLDERTGEVDEQIADLLADQLADGGCALVVHNTVGRAQQTYTAVKQRFGADEVVLLHARLIIGERVHRTETVIRKLSPDGPRPPRQVVVATQVAEQSFDVDADLLITDLAPIDLLLQRIGRLHRHDRPSSDRPERVRTPRVVVTGMTRHCDGRPSFPPGSSAVYGDHLLLRSAALVAAADGGVWSVPDQVPDLVRRGYGDDPIVPAGWTEAAEQAATEHHERQERRRDHASEYLLGKSDERRSTTLAGLHDRGSPGLPDDDAVAAVVRDGPPSIEVVLVCQDQEGGPYTTLDGTPLGPTGEAVSHADVAREVTQSTVRLPAGEDLTKAATDALGPLPAWSIDPWLARSRALVLDGHRRAELTVGRGRVTFTYDDELGLIHTRQGAR